MDNRDHDRERISPLSTLTSPLLLKHLCLEGKAGFLMQAKEEVHRMHSIARRAFKQSVNNRCQVQLTVIYNEIKEAFVGIDHVGVLHRLVYNKCEIVVIVVRIV